MAVNDNIETLKKEKKSDKSISREGQINSQEPKKRQKRTIESREKINKAAWELFQEKGYFQTNTKEISKRAGVSVGNFYNYYKDKKEVYLALLMDYYKGSYAALENLKTSIATYEEPQRAFYEYAKSQFDRADQSDLFFSDCHVVMRDDENMMKMHEESEKETIAQIEELLRSGKGIVKRASYPVMARVLYKMVDKISEDVLATKGTEIYEEYFNAFINLVSEYVFGVKYEPEK